MPRIPESARRVAGSHFFSSAAKSRDEASRLKAVAMDLVFMMMLADYSG
jgi:hypothetical protein